MAVDPDGRAYIGNLGWNDEIDRRIQPTVLLRVDSDGSVAVAAEDLVNPNGMAITPDGRTLMVAETFAARVTAFAIGDGGVLGDRRTWAAFADPDFETMNDAFAAGVLLPDGIALDQEGALWVGDCRGFGASRVAEGGEVLARVDTAPYTTFAVTLGGRDRRTLFLCTGPRFGTVDHRDTRESAMCAAPVAVPGAGLP